MTYNELLNQKEWWSKCNEILGRDHYTCKDCGCLGFHNEGNFIKLNNIKEIDSLLKGRFLNGTMFSMFWADVPYNTPHPTRNIKFDVERNINGLTAYSLHNFIWKNSLFENIALIPDTIIAVSEKEIERLDATLYFFNQLSKDTVSKSKYSVMRAYLFEFPSIISNDTYVNIEYSTASDKMIFNVTSDKRVLSMQFSPSHFPLKGLNIHHTYYIKGHKPWEYEDDALVTLCENCHKKRHEKAKTPIYTSQGAVIGYATVCPRCGGSGYLPQYSHVEHGRCFKCGGEGVIIND